MPPNPLLKRILREYPQPLAAAYRRVCQERNPKAWTQPLLGTPRQGKSALMAELARREVERGGCLLHMFKSHPSPRRFLPALLSQAVRQTRIAFGPDAYAGSLDDLREALVKGLAVLRQRAGRAVVVLDTLDELDEEGRRATFLPPDRRAPADSLRQGSHLQDLSAFA